MSSASTGSSTNTYVTSETTVDAATVAETYANTLTATEAVARYVCNDLRQIVADANVPLAARLQAPPDIAKDDQVVVELLCHDIERMLRNRLIREIHLLLSDDTMGDNQRYPLRYRARYIVHQHNTINRPDKDKAWKSIVKAPGATLKNADFTFGISWNPGLSRERIAQVCPPEYFFRWAPQGKRFDTTGLVQYRFGGIAGQIEVRRIEYAPAAVLGS